MKVVVLTTSYPRSPERHRRDVRPGRRRGAACGGCGGRCRLSCPLPPLRDRLRRRDPEQPAGTTVARCSCCRSSSSPSPRPPAGRRRDADVVVRPLAPLGAAGARRRPPARGAALGLGRRAGPAVPWLWRGAAPPRADGRVRVRVARRRRTRARARGTCGSSRSAVAVPAEVGEPDEPPHVLFVGRLSEEKGILEFLEATEGLRRVIVGDGPFATPRAGGGRLRPARRDWALLRAGRSRLRAVAAGGVRDGGARGDGLRTAGRRDPRRRAGGRDRGRGYGGVGRSGGGRGAARSCGSTAWIVDEAKRARGVAAGQVPDTIGRGSPRRRTSDCLTESAALRTAFCRSRPPIRAFATGRWLGGPDRVLRHGRGRNARPTPTPGGRS